MNILNFNVFNNKKLKNEKKHKKMPFYKIKTVYKRLLQLYLSIYAATHFWTR